MTSVVALLHIDAFTNSSCKKNFLSLYRRANSKQFWLRGTQPRQQASQSGGKMEGVFNSGEVLARVNAMNAPAPGADLAAPAPIADTPALTGNESQTVIESQQSAPLEG